MRFLCRGKGGERGPSERSPLWVFAAVGTAPWPARPGPPFLGKNGERTRGGGSSPRPPLCGVVEGRLYFLLGYPACGPLFVTSNGPAHRLGGLGTWWVPFGRRQKVTVWFPAFSSRQQTTSPARPSWWAGHEALVLEAAGQAHTALTTFPHSSHQRMGFQGEGTSFPLVFFPISSKKYRPRRASSLPFQRHREKPHAPQGQVEVYL